MAMSILDVSPRGGWPGTVVTVSGTGFETPEGTLTVDGELATINSWTDISIEFVVPPGVNTNGNYILRIVTQDLSDDAEEHFWVPAAVPFNDSLDYQYPNTEAGPTQNVDLPRRAEAALYNRLMDRIAISGEGYSEPVIDIFNVSGGQTLFTLSSVPRSESTIQFRVNGIDYTTPTFFSVSGLEVTWLDVPFTLAATDRVDIFYFTSIVLESLQLPARFEELTISGDGQTVFTLPQAPAANTDVILLVNGIQYSSPTFFTVSGTTLTWLDVLFTLTTSMSLEAFYITAPLIGEPVLNALAIASDGQTLFTLSPIPSTPVVLYIEGKAYSSPTHFGIAGNYLTWNDTPFTLATTMRAEALFYKPTETLGEPIVETLTVTGDGQTVFTLNSTPKGPVIVLVEGLQYSSPTFLTVSGTTLTWLDATFSLLTTMRVEAYYTR